MIEIIGYLGSFFVAAAMLFNSIIRLRWLSLIGSTLFTIYGFTIGAYPVGAVNAFIMIINIIYLAKIYTKKEDFRTLEIKHDNKYLLDFLEFHKQDIKKFFPSFNSATPYNVSLLVMRNMQVAGVFLAEAKNDKVIIKLDYVTPEYRDYKLGTYIYNNYQVQLKSQGYKKFISDSYSNSNDKYLKRLGFKKVKEGEIITFVKIIT